ncbi:MAG: ATPase, T2SS/T4P/T4SS family, partial [Alphaproteobacteria bacterium]
MTAPDGPGKIDTSIRALRDRLLPQLRDKITPEQAKKFQRGDIAQIARDLSGQFLADHGVTLNALDQRDLVTALINGYLTGTTPAAAPSSLARSADAPGAIPVKSVIPTPQAAANLELGAELPESRRIVSSVDQAKARLQPILMERIDTSAAAKMDRPQLTHDVTELVNELLNETRIQLNAAERTELVTRLLDDMLGLGPLEPLLAEESISEIMVNGPKHVYVEQRGKLTLSGVQFRDNAHVLGVATRIVTAIGRRIDETTPLCDARLMDGSRVNII